MIEKNDSMTSDVSREERQISIRSCPLCYRRFVDKFSCKRHVRNVHSELITNSEIPKKKLECNLCGRKFLYSARLQNHIKFCDGEQEKNFNCERCGKKFKYDVILRSHMKKHKSEDEGFKCDLCDSKFSRKDNLYKHEARVHNVHNIDFKALEEGFRKTSICKLCKIDFESDFKTFKAHIVMGNCNIKPVTLSANDLTRIECEYCEKSFASNDSLKRHIDRKHGNDSERLFSCEQCDKSYVNKSSLVKHKKKYTGFSLNSNIYRNLPQCFKIKLQFFCIFYKGECIIK